LGRLGSFGIPILILAIDIVLRLLMIEKKGMYTDIDGSENVQQSDYLLGTTEANKSREERAVDTAASYSAFPAPETATEGSPLLQRERNTGSKTLTFRDFLNPRLLSSVFLVAILSSILSAFETVRDSKFRDRGLNS
jgi:hypothetical protein